MPPVQRPIVAVSRQGVMRLIECCPSWHDGELRVDLQPVMDALGVAVDLEGVDYGVLVLHHVGAGPCLRCPLRDTTDRGEPC